MLCLTNCSRCSDDRYSPRDPQLCDSRMGSGYGTESSHGRGGCHDNVPLLLLASITVLHSALPLDTQTFCLHIATCVWNPESNNNNMHLKPWKLTTKVLKMYSALPMLLLLGDKEFYNAHKHYTAHKDTPTSAHTHKQIHWRVMTVIYVLSQRRFFWGVTWRTKK